MKSALFALSALLVATSLAFADPIGNIASLLQNRDGGQVKIEQIEMPWGADMVQVNQYTRSINNNRASNSGITIRQDSTFVGERATIQQYGNANTVAIDQSSSNTATIDQSCSFNIANIDQSGTSKFAQISQTGNSNSAMVIQH